MERFFNTAGPIKQDMHYYVSLFDRCDYKEIEALINQEKYFILHAPRQTGKTSALLEIMDRINNEGRYSCAYVNIEPAQAARDNVEREALALLCKLLKHIRLRFRKACI